MWSKLAQNFERTVEEGGGRRVNGNKEFDAIVIGSGIGGLVAATQLAVKDARVLVLEKYVIPGGSSGFYQRDGYTFDVGSSVMFGFSDKVSLFFLGVYFCSADYSAANLWYLTIYGLPIMQAMVNG